VTSIAKPIYFITIRVAVRIVIGHFSLHGCWSDNGAGGAMFPDQSRRFSCVERAPARFCREFTGFGVATSRSFFRRLAVPQKAAE
jgi:hypothetical protein